MQTAKQQSLPHGYVLQGENNRYIIDRVLGQGAFGITYLARYKVSIQGSIGKGSVWAQVAIKEFFMRDLNVRDGSTGYLNDSSQDSIIGKYRRAFVREAHNLARLSHPGIVNVFEVIETNNTVYIVMEFIDGGSLDDYISSKGRLTEKESLTIFCGICIAVGFMHQHRMLHLDLKPKNIMLDEERHPLLIDFGLSKQYTEGGEPESSTSIGLGTPGYAPIEQAERTDNDSSFRPTIDIYALGGTLYKMLTGNTPPLASKVSESALEGENLIATTLNEQGISAATTSLVTKAMWPASKKRYQNTTEMVSAIDEILREHGKDNAGSKPAGGIKGNTNNNSDEDEETVVVNSSKTTKQSFASASATKLQQEKTQNLKTAPVNKETNDKKSKSGFPNWLYAVIAAILVGIIVFIAIPKSKPTITPTPTPTPERVKEEIVAPSPTPTPAPKKEEAKPEEPKTIALTSISLSKTSLTLEEGATSTLTVKYTPSDATDKSTTWKSTDTKVATVSNNGKVTAVKAGIAAIIATASGKESYCNVTVTAKSQPVQQQSATTTSSGSATGTSNGHEWIDLGLSVKWATCNIGASSPSAYGDYYAWGETSTKSSYTWENYRFRTSGDSYENVKFSKYNTQSDRGSVDNRTVLEMSDDVARQKWGGSWRMPTEKEFQELIANCTWTWTTMNGVNGYKVTSKKSGYTDRSIFLPAAGYRYDTSLIGAGENGYYWSSSLYSGYPNFAMELGFDSGSHSTDYDRRFSGNSVRPVCP